MEMFLVGKIINTHGLKGLIRIEYYLKDPNKLELISRIFIGENQNKYEIKKILSGKKILLELKEVQNIDDAETLKNKNIYIDVKEKELLIEDKDEYFVEDIIGMKVYDEKMEFIGTITKIYQTGKNDIYELDNNDKKLIPASKEFIKKIDLKNKNMIVELIEGLI